MSIEYEISLVRVDAFTIHNFGCGMKSSEDDISASCSNSKGTLPLRNSPSWMNITVSRGNVKGNDGLYPLGDVYCNCSLQSVHMSFRKYIVPILKLLLKTDTSQTKVVIQINRISSLQRLYLYSICIYIYFLQLQYYFIKTAISSLFAWNYCFDS